MIVCQNLVKSYGATQAVNGLSFEVRQGETLGLLGPNGAGKSTTIQMLIGLVRPDAGEVRIHGADPWDRHTRRRIGVAPQSLSLYEELTAQENLQFFARMYGLHGKQLADQVAWSLRFAGLDDRRRHRVATFSGGMKRRLNLAIALVHQPEVVLLDEPTVGVDPQSRNHLFESIEQLRAQGLTILYTTHYMEEARRLCDRVAIMDHGKLLAVDSVTGLIEAHGGESQVVAEVVDVPAGLELPAKPTDQSLTFFSKQPLAEIARLSGAGLRFQSLRVQAPDLESVFLKLTGRRLRD